MKKIMITLLLIGILSLVGCAEDKAEMTNVSIAKDHNITSLSLNEPMNVSCDCSFPEVKDYSTDLQEIKNSVNRIKLSCPEPEVITTVCNNDDELISMDKAKFRYKILLEDYDIFRKEVKLSNYVYCLDKYADLVDDLSITNTFISEYSEKEANQESYIIWIKTSDYLELYLTQVYHYCSNRIEPPDKYYEDYLRYHNYYDFLINGTTMPKLEILREVKYPI